MTPPPSAGSSTAELPPYKRLFQKEKAEPQQEPQQEQPQQQEEEAPLTELQQQMLTAYRKTFLVAGLGMLGAVWRWKTVTRHKMDQDVFVPPRAQALPEEVVERWKQKAQMREGLRTIGKQTLLVTGVAGLYFGSELAVGLLRDKPGDWANTAAAGALAGGLLGSRVPSSMRGRTMLMGSAVGGMMGALSGWGQQTLHALSAGLEQEQQQPQQQQQQQPSHQQQPQQQQEQQIKRAT